MELTQKRTAGGSRGLMATRKGTLAVAAVCALAAAVVIAFGFAKYRQSVNSGNLPETVLVASGLIQKGTGGSVISREQLFKPATIVARQVTKGAIADASILTGKVAATDIYPGQQLTLADFVSAGGLTATLAPGQRAVSVPVDAAPGLVGNVAAGDHVDVYVGFTSNSSGRATPILKLLASDVRVLQTPSGGGAGFGSTGSQGGNVTIAVSDNLAPLVMFAANNGKLWLALRPGNASNPPNPQEVVTLETILLGSAPISSPGGNG